MNRDVEEEVLLVVNLTARPALEQSVVPAILDSISPMTAVVQTQLPQQHFGMAQHAEPAQQGALSAQAFQHAQPVIQATF